MGPRLMALKRTALASMVIVVSVLIAMGVAWAGGHGGVEIAGIPLIVGCAWLAFAVQWVAFVPAFVRQTERFYDLVGSLTYMAVTALAIAGSRPTDARSALLGILVFVWALRLGSFLFRRIQAAGSDPRFDEIKPSAPRFLVAWTLQGLWVFLTLSAALAAITTLTSAELGLADAVGHVVWVGGFAIEVVSARQTSRLSAERPGHIMTTGRWGWSRHPNYFGEIVLWTGIAIIASSTLRGWQWVTMISPLFVIVLLTRVSGIPMLERRADERWGGDERYRRYKSSTPVLIPRPPRR